MFRTTKGRFAWWFRIHGDGRSRASPCTPYRTVTPAHRWRRTADDGEVIEPTQRRSQKISPRSAHPEAEPARMKGMTTSERPNTKADISHPRGPQPWRPSVAAAGLVGVVAMGLAIGIAELLAAFGEWIGIFTAPSSPLNSLGQTFIQFTPEWLKEFA